LVVWQDALAAVDESVKRAVARERARLPPEDLFEDDEINDRAESAA
jgi:hypothetical protein